MSLLKFAGKLYINSNVHMYLVFTYVCKYVFMSYRGKRERLAFNLLFCLYVYLFSAIYLPCIVLLHCAMMSWARFVFISSARCCLGDSKLVII